MVFQPCVPRSWTGRQCGPVLYAASIQPAGLCWWRSEPEVLRDFWQDFYFMRSLSATVWGLLFYYCIYNYSLFIYSKFSFVLSYITKSSPSYRCITVSYITNLYKIILFCFVLKFCVIWNYSGADFFNFHTLHMYIPLYNRNCLQRSNHFFLQWSGISADLGWCPWVTGRKRQTGAGVHLHQTCPCCSHEAWQVSSLQSFTSAADCH